MIEVEIVNQSAFELPAYATEGAAGLDIRANITNPVVLAPLERQLIPTGLFVAIPLGYEIQIRPRSGLAAKHGITVLNTPGTIDCDYSGDGEDFELKVILFNHNRMPFSINNGDRIAQMVVAKLAEHDLVEVEEFNQTANKSRKGGLGSTGK